MPTTWTFPRGVLGFPDFTAPTFAYLPDTDELYGLLSDTAGTEFLVTRPDPFFPDLLVEIDDSVQAALGLTDAADAQLWVMVRQTPEGLVANLRGPLVVNRHTGVAAQIVLDASQPTAAPLRADA